LRKRLGGWAPAGAFCCRFQARRRWDNSYRYSVASENFDADARSFLHIWRQGCGDEIVSDDNVVNLEGKLLAKGGRQREIDRSAGNLRILSRAVHEMREQGANSIEIAASIRLTADELDGR
jgi:hypothetical protein